MGSESRLQWRAGAFRLGTMGGLVEDVEGSFLFTAGAAALSFPFAIVERSSLIKSGRGLSCHGLEEKSFIGKDTVTSKSYFKVYFMRKWLLRFFIWSAYSGMLPVVFSGIISKKVHVKHRQLVLFHSSLTVLAI